MRPASERRQAVEDMGDMLKTFGQALLLVAEGIDKLEKLTEKNNKGEIIDGSYRDIKVIQKPKPKKQCD